MKKKTNKKAFTIVELVIVIAVLAILAAVLIPTFANLVRKANVSNDTQLVRNLNTALISANKEHKTMQEALDTAEEYGFNVEKISAKASENEILWDSINDCFVYKTEDGIEYIPNSKKTDREIKDYEYWQIADELPETQKYSIYAGTDWNTATIENLCVGFDAGKSTCVTSVNYVRSAESTPQAVTIRTNSGTLVINAPNDIVLRYGHCDLLDIQAIKSTSLHEYGTSSMASVKVGRIIFEKENSTDVVFVEGNNAIVAVANNIDMPKIKRAADVSTYKLQTVETTETDVTKKTETVVTISGENVTTETKDESNNTVDTPANIRIEDVKESSKIETTKENIKNEFVPIRINTFDELKEFISADNPSKNCILCNDITITSTLYIERDLTIDFNGYTISCSNPTGESKCDGL